MTNLEEKIKELEELQKKIPDVLEVKNASEREKKQAQEILSQIKKYTSRGDIDGLKRYLTHTQNELRRTN